MRTKIFSAAIVLFAALFSSVLAQVDEQPFDFYSRGNYNPAVPRPQSILRFDVGEQHTTYAQMEKVIEAIAEAAPDRVKIFDIGLTNENRMQHIVAISSPENMARLDAIKAANARLTDPRVTDSGAADNIIRDNPVVAWMAYTIHGNESASFETMMQVVYQLAASNEPATLDVLDKTVVLIITGENPDGHERFATWYNSVAVGDPNPAAFEHREPWSIWGRYNRYRFDLNRDNIAISQKETQNMTSAYFEWNPQVAVDHHGQPDQFFFPPAALPINPNLPQPATNRWLDIFGRANGKAFDAEKWDYYVRDIFDLFYPGYWDSMPSLNGAIGMTYETDGGGNKGLKYRRDDGTYVTLRSAVAKHYVASMTTLETAAANREARLRDFYRFRADAMEQARREKMKRIVIVPDKDRVKAAEMVEILRRTKIEVRVANSAFRSASAHSYMEKDAGAETVNFPAGSYVIDLSQPQKTWIKALLEQHTPQDKEFIEDNVARFKRNQVRGSRTNREYYGFYDITAWSLPLAFGIDAYWTEDASGFDSASVTDDYLAARKRGSVSGRGEIAYVFPYETDSSAVLALRLMQKGFRVYVSARQLNAGGRNWAPGTFVVRVTRNKEGVHDAIREMATELGVNVTGVNSGYADEGDTGVGSSNVYPLRKPKIAMLADETVNNTSYGATWWMLDKYGVKFTPLSLQAVRFGALEDYNVLIIPDASPGRLFSGFGKPGADSLKEWISKGGTLITMKGASVFATLKDVGLSSSVLVGSGDDKGGDDKKSGPADDPDSGTGTGTETAKPDKAEEMPVLPPIVSPSANPGKVPEGVPGAIFRATVDRTTYLNYGIEQDSMPVLLASGYFFRYSIEGSNALVFDKDPSKPLTISGYIWEGNTEPLLKGTSYLIDERVGGGHVIMFADDVFFRAIFRANTRQFMNAIVLTGAF